MASPSACGYSRRGRAPDWLWGATPFGWTSYLHEVDQACGQVLGAFVVLVAVLAAAALALARHDL